MISAREGWRVVTAWCAAGVVALLLPTLALAQPAPALSPAPDLAREVVGVWRMEDVYTLHNSEGSFRIESHPPGAFVSDVTFLADGTGEINGDRFAWSTSGDEMQWIFSNGARVSMLARFLDRSHFMVIAAGPSGVAGGSAISSLRRVR